ncbi:hypothetical protein DDQ41_15270 [Streptomyces spongiicola]|uniref:HTH cro/C1-type domain-containing protein n=1 Tax=Streptomyces spongiicola TaxID=1690221 RepID=A0ABM6V7S5_9ACTN|nr:hypothetical protein [Streptomyces spongiicola]AWK10030.1 hypothetical protein DDQ41_15270 [Streptomyces spongiicola]
MPHPRPEPEHPAATPFAQALGERIRQAREADQRTADNIAHSARRLGLTWHRTTVGATERGERAITATELLMLPLLYRRPLRTLLPDPDAGTTRLTAVAAVDNDELHKLLEEDHKPRPKAWQIDDAHWWDELREFAHAIGGLLAPWPTSSPDPALMAAPDEAESKAAKRLETTAHFVAYGARALWGRGLAAERDARLAERPDAPDMTARARQAARGHITRTLIGELEPLIRDYNRQRAAEPTVTFRPATDRQTDEGE